MRATAVSVVIPAYNAAASLRRCLDGVVGQDYPDLEVIVVDDASADDTAAVAAAVTGVRVLRIPENRGPAAARNRGVAAAHGAILIFLDSDAVVDDRYWVAKHAAAHAGREPTIVGGGVQGVGRGVVARADAYCHWCTNIPLGLPAVTTAASARRRLTRHLVTNNMSLRRSTFDRLGAFDEEFRTGEDVDFCERALQQGVALRLEPSIAVQHRDRERLRDFVTCFFRVGRDRIPLREKHRQPLSWLLPRGVVSSLLVAPPLTAALWLQTTLRWWPHDHRVALYAPVILLAYASMAAGMTSFLYGRRRARGRDVQSALRPA
jgi:glycosyltransferase involved in cell wall biosynthesis